MYRIDNLPPYILDKKTGHICFLNIALHSTDKTHLLQIRYSYSGYVCNEIIDSDFKKAIWDMQKWCKKEGYL